MAFALVFILLAGCAAPEGAIPAAPSVSDSAMPAAAVSPAPSNLSESIATTAPDIPTVTSTPEPSPPPSPIPGASSVSFVGQIVCTASDAVNIRSEASRSSDIVGTLPGGMTADVIVYEGSWAHIYYNGITGYVSQDYTIPRHLPSISVPSGDWASILVNAESLLPEGFTVDVVDFAGGQVDRRILKICSEMFTDAKEDGIKLKLVDAYRSYDLQKKLFEDKVDSYTAKGYSRKDAEAKAATITARPNTSEHQTGLALDIVTPSYTKRDKGFADTDAFQWLNANAQDYGFTLRYKKDKQNLTGVIYEPWHWRFVGVKAARAMKDNGECLEEYFEEG